MSKSSDFYWVLCGANIQHFLVFDHNCYLGIPATEHAPIVDICRSNEDYPIIDYEQFAMHIDYLCDRLPTKQSMRPQSIELDVLAQVINVTEITQ